MMDCRALVLPANMGPRINSRLIVLVYHEWQVFKFNGDLKIDIFYLYMKANVIDF
jgi:hypothetical protein